MKLTRETDLAAEWDMTLDQFRVLRRRHGWAHVRFSRQDIRYTAEQIAAIVRDLTQRKAIKAATDEQTSRSRARAS